MKARLQSLENLIIRQQYGRQDSGSFEISSAVPTLRNENFSTFPASGNHCEIMESAFRLGRFLKYRNPRKTPDEDPSWDSERPTIKTEIDCFTANNADRLSTDHNVARFELLTETNCSRFMRYRPLDSVRFLEGLLLRPISHLRAHSLACVTRSSPPPLSSRILRDQLRLIVSAEDRLWSCIRLKPKILPCNFGRSVEDPHSIPPPVLVYSIIIGPIWECDILCCSSASILIVNVKTISIPSACSAIVSRCDTETTWKSRVW